MKIILLLGRPEMFNIIIKLNLAYTLQQSGPYLHFLHPGSTIFVRPHQNNKK